MPDDITREARELCERATPGPWDHKITAVYKGQTAVRICGDFDDFDADARFIARSRTLIPELLDLLAAKDAEIARLTAERGAVVEDFTSAARNGNILCEFCGADCIDAGNDTGGDTFQCGCFEWRGATDN